MVGRSVQAKLVTLTRHRRLILVVTAVAAASCVLFSLGVVRSAPDVRLRFLSLTNDSVSAFKLGLFELRNGTSHRIHIAGGPFESGGRSWAFLWASDVAGANIFLSPGGVSRFWTYVPERGGPYRLVLSYNRVPTPPLFAPNVRWRLADVLDRKASYKLRWRLLGENVVQSQPFTVSEGSPIRHEDIPVVR